MNAVMEKGKTGLKHTDVFQKLALLSKVMSKGVAEASKYYFDKDLEYITSLAGKSQNDLVKERKRLDKLLQSS